MEKEKVLEIKVIKINEKYSVWWIVYQNENVLKRSKFKDRNLKVYSITLPRFYYGINDDLYLRGEDRGCDTIPNVIKNEAVDKLLKIVEKVNEKYGILKKWRAEKGKFYYFIDEFMAISENREMNDIFDIARYKLGNYFQTKEEAREYADKIKKLLQERE